MSKQTAVEWLVEQLLANAFLRLTKDEHSVYKELKDQAKAMEREQIEENMAKAITFGWDLSHHHRHNTEEKLLQMQKDFIISVIEGGEQ